MKIIECQQRSNDWFKARLGLPTASKIGVLFTPTGKQAANATRRRYALELAIEKLTKRPTFVPTTFHMDRGTELEPQARIWYYLETRRKADEIGFALADSGLTGCSPDGFVSNDGAVEIKCPAMPHFAEIIMTGEIDAAWLMQCHHTLYVTGRDWIDFVLYTDVEPFTGWIKRIYRDDEICEKIEQAVEDFTAEVQDMTETLIERGGLTQDMLKFEPPIFNDCETVDITM